MVLKRVGTRSQTTVVALANRIKEGIRVARTRDDARELAQYERLGLLSFVCIIISIVKSLIKLPGFSTKCKGGSVAQMNLLTETDNVTLPSW